MEKCKKGDHIIVYWDDAVIYGKGNVPDLEKLKPAKTITEGKLVKDSDEFVIIASPRTVVYKPFRKKYIPKLSESGKKITFFFIPKAVITKITHQQLPTP